MKVKDKRNDKNTKQTYHDIFELSTRRKGPGNLDVVMWVYLSSQSSINCLHLCARIVSSFDEMAIEEYWGVFIYGMLS